MPSVAYGGGVCVSGFARVVLGRLERRRGERYLDDDEAGAAAVGGLEVYVRLVVRDVEACHRGTLLEDRGGICGAERRGDGKNGKLHDAGVK